MLIRREEPADVAAIAGIHAAAFGGEVEKNLVTALRASSAWLPRLSLVAELDGRVAGHVVCTRAHVAETPALGLGPLGVLPAEQRSGVGSALTHAVLAAADALDEPVVVLLGHTDYYPRFGLSPRPASASSRRTPSGEPTSRPAGCPHTTVRCAGRSRTPSRSTSYDAGDRRVQVEGFRAELREPRLAEPVPQLPGGAGGGLGGRAGTAGLTDEHDPPALPEQPTQLAEPPHGVRPEPHRVHGEHDVERLVEARQPLDRGLPQHDLPGTDGGRVAPARLPQHHRRVIDAVDSTPGGEACQFRDGDAGAETDLEHVVRRAHVEQGHHPQVALPIGGAMGHHPSGQPTAHAARPVELAYEAGDHALLQRVRGHGRQSTTSSGLEVKELTIGELARTTGVATSALRYWEELGLLPAPARVAGRRRYPESAVGLVGVILALRDVGFTLNELATLMATRGGDLDSWRELYARKLAELDDRIAQMRAARTALAHGLACGNPDGVFRCANFARGVAGRLAGLPLHEAHTHGED